MPATKHFKTSTVALLDTLNTLAQSAGVSFVLTGGAEYGYHARGTYSHENGYKVDISDSGVYAGTTAYRILLEALTPFKHHLSHEWNNNHYDITIYPADYTGSYSGADLSRDMRWAGKTVQKNCYAITYDENGYAVSATNVRSGAAREDLANVYPRVDADGDLIYPTYADGTRGSGYAGTSSGGAGGGFGGARGCGGDGRGGRAGRGR